MRFPLVLALVSLFLTFSSPVQGTECQMTTSDPEFDSANVAGTGAPGEVEGMRFYVDNDFIPGTHEDFLFSIWLYQESNGVDGLQRWDEMKDDTCGGRYDGDATWCLLLPAALAGGRKDRRSGSAGDAALVAALAVGGTIALAPTAAAC